MRETLLRQALHAQYKDSSNFNVRVALSARFSVNPQSINDFVFERLDVPLDGSVLELGCGPGYFWLRNRERIPEKLNITLTDFSGGMLAETQQSLGRLRRPFNFAVADAQEIPFAANSFDAVVANLMLYHVIDKPKAFAGIRRVLKPGGKLYATTMGINQMKEVRELLRRFDPDFGYAGYLTRGLSFNLENGAALLAPWFSNITMERHPDALEVSEGGPLADYILSTNPSPRMQERRAELSAFFEREIAAHGPLHISKDAGLFIAQRAEVKLDRLDHLVLTVKSVDESCEFYSRVLGMDVLAFGDGRKALRFGQQKINLHEKGREIDPHAEYPTPGSGDLCFITSIPLDDIVAHLKANNVEIIAGPAQRDGALGSIQSVYFRDPDQNLIEVSNYL